MRSVVQFAVGVVLFAILMRAFLVMGLFVPVTVSGSSMAPRLDGGDSLWIDRTAYELRGPRRWDVVVFQCPDDATQLCVKRVLGLPGERIALHDGDLFVNGTRVPKPLDIDYELRPGDGLGQPGFDPRQRCWQLRDGFFAVGDNQAVSVDSRNWPAGPDLPPRLLVGRPIGRY